MNSPLTTDQMSGTQAWIADWQRRVRECPKVFAVFIRCDGESDLDTVYDSREAAQAHVDWYNANNRNGYLGKASISTVNVQTLKLAQERFQKPVPQTALRESQS